MTSDEAYQEYLEIVSGLVTDRPPLRPQVDPSTPKTKQDTLRQAVFVNLQVAFQTGLAIFDEGDAEITSKILRNSSQNFREKYTEADLLPHVVEWKAHTFRSLIEVLRHLRRNSGTTH